MTAMTSATVPAFWFVPVWSGDFRLERDPTNPEHCLLTVEDPTPADAVLLDKFLVHARLQGWVSAMAGVAPRGVTILPVGATMLQAGPLLASAVHGDAATWTLVRSTNGSVAVFDDVADAGLGVSPDDTTEEIVVADDQVRALVGWKVADVVKALDTKAYDDRLDAVLAAEKAGRDRKGVRRAVEARKAALAEPSAVDQLPDQAPAAPAAVATTRPPARGCPAPTACERRASQVLRTFCTTSQWSHWQRHGYLRATGNYTGRAYHVFHRNEAARRGMGHALALASGGEVCAWDNRVPPEEEALGLKMAIEHREKWLLADTHKEGVDEANLGRRHKASSRPPIFFPSKLFGP